MREALQAVDLDEHRTKFPTALSGGMRKRTGIARAIIDHSECILYDEPNSGLDPIGSDIIDQTVSYTHLDVYKRQLPIEIHRLFNPRVAGFSDRDDAPMHGGKAHISLRYTRHA